MLAMPAMAALSRAHPSARICAVVAPRTRDLVDGQDWIYEVVEWDNAWPVTRLAGILRKRGIDTTIHFYPRGRQALAARMAGVRLRVGTAYRWYSFLFNRRIPIHRSRNVRHEAEYNMDLLEPLGVPPGTAPELVPPVATEQARAEARSLVERAGLGDGFVVVHPASLGSSLNASPEWYGRLARAIESAGMVVAVTGTAAEGEIIERVLRESGLPASRYVGPSSLKSLTALLALARGFVGPSTGPLHIAASLKMPVVGIYTPVHSQSPVRWGPLSPRASVVQSLTTDMDAVPVDDVVRALRAALERA